MNKTLVTPGDLINSLVDTGGEVLLLATRSGVKVWTRLAVLMYVGSPKLTSFANKAVKIVALTPIRPVMIVGSA